MKDYLRALDWKVLLFALLACYVVPAFFFGTLISAVVGESASGVRQTIASMLVASALLLPPLASGYFVARYASSLPKLHVALVAVLGVAIYYFQSQSPWPVQLVYYSLVIMLCALGAFMRLRKERVRGA